MSTTTPPIPTVGRIVLVPVENHAMSRIDILPAMVTHVHSDICVSVVVFSAFGDTVAMQKTSLLYNREDQRPGTWHWMPYQMQTAGIRHQDAPKI